MEVVRVSKSTKSNKLQRTDSNMGGFIELQKGSNQLYSTKQQTGELFSMDSLSAKISDILKTCMNK